MEYEGPDIKHNSTITSTEKCQSLCQKKLIQTSFTFQTSQLQVHVATAAAAAGVAVGKLAIAGVVVAVFVFHRFVIGLSCCKMYAASRMEEN